MCPCVHECVCMHECMWRVYLSMYCVYYLSAFPNGAPAGLFFAFIITAHGLFKHTLYMPWFGQCTHLTRWWSLVTVVMRGGGGGGSRNRLSWTAVCSRHKRPSTEQGQLSSSNACNNWVYVCTHLIYITFVPVSMQFSLYHTFPV